MTRLTVALGFMVAFAAGALVGVRVQSEPSAAQPSAPERRGGWLTAQLDLTPQQEEQMKRIWSEAARRGGREMQECRRQARRERDEALAALVHPEDKAEYDRILQAYGQRIEQLDRQWKDAFRNAVEQTKLILTPGQRAKYEQLLQRHEADRGGRDSGRGGREHKHGRRGFDGAAAGPGSEN